MRNYPIQAIVLLDQKYKDLTSDYEALAAQRDEGLAREEELKRLLILAWQGEHIRPEDCKKLDAICNGPAYTNKQKSE